jgi:hypothetical protein
LLKSSKNMMAPRGSGVGVGVGGLGVGLAGIAVGLVGIGVGLGSDRVGDGGTEVFVGSGVGVGSGTAVFVGTAACAVAMAACTVASMSTLGVPPQAGSSKAISNVPISQCFFIPSTSFACIMARTTLPNSIHLVARF